MTYVELLSGIQYTGETPGGEASLVAQDSRKVRPGAVYVCIKGQSSDGHDFAKAALEAGAGLIVAERPIEGVPKGRLVMVQNSRTALAALCQNFFGNPAKKLTLVAVTGTNGKTTVTSVLRQLLESQGVRTGLIGSIQSEMGAMVVPAKFTTPEAWDLAALFSRMVAAGCTHVVMEASSQALAQGRLAGLHFKLAVFTNLTRDHLDYHGSMESYYQAKKLLFAQSDVLLSNCDDDWGRRLLREAPCRENRGFSMGGSAADFAACNVSLGPGAVCFALGNGGVRCPVRFPMPGEYSVYNALAAAGSAILLGCGIEAVAKALAGIKPVRGRCEVLHSGEFTVIRDFAHTADGLEKLLSALRPFAKGQLVVLYGCAGERDAAKRAPMSETVLRYADRIFLTSDNPRAEPIEAIFADALPPLAAGNIPYTAQKEREAAVYAALDTMKPDGLLVLCGKGHEDYQVLDGVTVYLDERQLVENWLAGKGIKL